MYFYIEVSRQKETWSTNLNIISLLVVVFRSLIFFPQLPSYFLKFLQGMSYIVKNLNEGPQVSLLFSQTSNWALMVLDRRADGEGLFTSRCPCLRVHLELFSEILTSCTLLIYIITFFSHFIDNCYLIDTAFIQASTIASNKTHC